MKEITLNFGAIRDSISRLSSNEILKESKTNTLNTFLNSVKKSPVLMKQHLIFKNIEDCKPFTKERLAERFISQNLNLLKGIKWQDVIKENRDLRITLLENSHVESNGGAKDELFNNIHTLIESTTKPGFSKIETEQNAYEYLVTYLTRTPLNESEKSNEKIDNPNLKNWEYVTKLAVNNFNERYSHLNENEKNILNMLLSDDNKKANYVEDLRLENIKIITNLLKESKNTEQTELLESFKEKLDKKPEFNSFTADDYILNYSELKESLEIGKKYYDLFDRYELQPKKLKIILDKYTDKLSDGMSYGELNKLTKELNKIGYTFDFGLDASPYGLRPVNVKLSDLEGYQDL